LDNRRIGVYDSGVGGLTVLREMEKVLPSEDLLYFGDSKNRPYGYQTEERLMYLITNVLDDFASKDVKAVALACNTISVLADRLEGKYPFPVFSIIQAAVNYVLKNHVRSVGIAGTKFTAASQIHRKMIQAADPDIRVVTQSFVELSSHIQNGEWKEVPACIEKYMRQLEEQGEVTHIIFSCTHYPIAREYFEAARPGIIFIDPAKEMAEEIRSWLASHDSLTERTEGSAEIYTSGEPEQYRAVLQKLGIRRPAVLEQRIIV